ncbi:MAG: hypothetical protein HQK53_15835 [Oligoflexia bacterium]|nr:hypothetical protein [Oligoflexia bacterium]
MIVSPSDVGQKFEHLRLESLDEDMGSQSAKVVAWIRNCKLVVLPSMAEEDLTGLQLSLMPPQPIGNNTKFFLGETHSIFIESIFQDKFFESFDDLFYACSEKQTAIINLSAVIANGAIKGDEEFATMITPQIIRNIIQDLSLNIDPDDFDAITRMILSILNEHNKHVAPKICKRLLRQFDQELDIYRGNSAEVSKMQQWALKFFSVTERRPELLFEVLKVPKLVDVLKNIQFISGSRDTIEDGVIMQNFDRFFENVDELNFQLLDKDSAYQNNLLTILRDHFLSNTLSFDDLISFLKVENDLIWMIALCERALTEKQKRGIPVDLLALDLLFKQSNYRVAMVLELFHHSNIPQWKERLISYIHPPKVSGSNKLAIDLECDFEHYGRWGDIGDLVFRLLEMPEKMLKKIESNVQSNVPNSSGELSDKYQRYMEVRERLYQSFISDRGGIVVSLFEQARSGADLDFFIGSN